MTPETISIINKLKKDLISIICDEDERFSIIREMEKKVILNNKINNDIIEVIKANPGLNGNELSKSLPYVNSTVYYHLKQLLKCGLVISKVKEGRVMSPRLYWVA